ncbi:MAG TPA: hypothetical protein VFV50_10580, partial [Bdellovibrionales bacterium]|nr:hypothetical protein [Bdellovibrionales bacterium]
FIFHNRSLGTVRDATSYVPGSGFAVHRAVFARAGGMDTALGTYWDDVDWSVRVQRAGFELRSDPNFVLRHYIGKTCHQNPLYSIYYFQRNRKRVSWKYTTHASRPWLAMRLTRSWARLGFNLLRKGRWRELKYLHRAVVD